ncbi:hypothetical protein Tco_0007337 [Tanacetum coccineum]
MADLEFVDQHNMVACLEKTTRNSEFHEIVDFLTSSLIHHALTVSPTIYISYIEQFWNTASSQTVNDENLIHATVDSKAVVVTEASIRSSLLFNDADGTACLTNEAIFQNLALMGYEGGLTKLTVQKALFSPQWKYLIHTILHCLSSKSTSWNEFSTNISLAVICLATNQKFNFSKLIFDEVEGGKGLEQPTELQPTPSPTQPSVGDQPHVSLSKRKATQGLLKSDEGFLVGYSLNSKAFRVYNLETKRVEENLHINFLENKPNVVGKGPNWLFDLDYLTDSMNYQPVTAENKANKTAGPKEANHSAGTQDNIDAGNSKIEAEPAQEYFVLPLWSSYTSTVKSSEAKNGDEKPNGDTGTKINEKPKDQEDLAFLE